MTRPYTLLLVCLFACFTSCKSVDSSTDLIDEDYRIYSAYLTDFPFYKNVPSAGAIIINDSTTFNPNNIHPTTPWSWVAKLGDRCHYLKNTVSCKRAQDPAWASLFETIKQASSLKQERLFAHKFTVRCPIIMRSQQAKTPSERQGDSLSTHYLFGLSRISFDQNKTRALFFASFYCGGKCGRGELVMLEKVNQTWLLIDTFRFWIS
ncbi:hypothetical protein [Spirosoma radiotolerans]|uniref:hypothetical protein n=1 Tax=Spirosoma radiotolerans TaxID=1379870 RepID=UPI000AA69669|nr:hypothetical protein [Spirosoma radiotolerans]